MRFPEDVPVLTDDDPRLRLRAHTAADIDAAYQMCSDPEFQRWTTVPVPYERHHAEGFLLDKIPAGWRDGGMWAWAIEHDGRFAGTVNLRDGRGRGGEVGFGLAPWARGKGLMTRAARLVVRYAFEGLGWDVVLWRAFVGNWESRRVAWRTGFGDFHAVHGGGVARDIRYDEWVATIRSGDDLEPQGRWLDVPVLRTERLRLRPVRDEDAERVVEATNDERTAEWLPHLPTPYGRDTALTWFGQIRENAATGEGLSWVIADPVTDDLLGNVSVFRLNDRAGNEIGYWMHPSARGKGVMTEAVRAVVRYACGELGCRRLYLRASEGNAASQHVARQTGFRHVGTGRAESVRRNGTFESLLVFDLLQTDEAVVESAG